MLRLSLGVFLSAEELLSQGRCVPGDLLEIDRKLYAHWVVYVGNGEVVHLPETDIEKAVVAKSSLEAVAQGCHVRVNNKVVPAKERRLEALPDEQVVVRAMKSVGDIVTYNIVVSNCEHFATQLKYGVGWSDQVEVNLMLILIVCHHIVKLMTLNRGQQTQDLYIFLLLYFCCCCC